MRKSDIAAQVADRTGLSRTEAADAVDAVLEAGTEALSRREEVRIAGFGLFATRYLPARAGRNPRTGEPVCRNSGLNWMKYDQTAIMRCYQFSISYFNDLPNYPRI